MSDSLLSCPTCGSQAIVKNGQTRHGKQNYKCNDCGRLSWCALAQLRVLGSLAEGTLSEGVSFRAAGSHRSLWKILNGERFQKKLKF